MTPVGKPRRRASTSLVIAGLLVCSAFVRLAGGTAEAVATELGGLPVGQERSRQPADGPVSPGVDAVMAELNARAKALDSREAALDRRAYDVAALSDAADRRLADLQSAEEGLRRVMSLAREAAQGDVAQLTDVYENMKPKEAAALFEEMAPEFAAGFLARMRAESAAAILAGLKPKTAYSISIILAARNLDVPTE